MPNRVMDGRHLLQSPSSPIRLDLIRISSGIDFSPKRGTPPKTMGRGKSINSPTNLSCQQDFLHQAIYLIFCDRYKKEANYDGAY